MTKIDFKICRAGSVGVEVIGLEKDKTDNPFYTNDFKYEDTTTVVAVVSIDSNEKIKTTDYIFDKHDKDQDSVTIVFPCDGLYSIYRTVVKKTDSRLNTLKFEELFPENDEQNWDYKMTFCMGYLQEQCYNMSEKYLEQYCTSCKVDYTDTFMHYIYVHIIDYLLDLEELYKAQHLLEKINRCRKQYTKTYNYDCGCS